jgi:hypothetical protein
MTLMLADRIDRVETMVSDALRGRPDNYVAEKGWGAYFTYATPERKRQLMMFGAAAIAAVALGVVLNNKLRED